MVSKRGAVNVLVCRSHSRVNYVAVRFDLARLVLVLPAEAAGLIDLISTLRVIAAPVEELLADGRSPLVWEFFLSSTSHASRVETRSPLFVSVCIITPLNEDHPPLSA